MNQIVNQKESRLLLIAIAALIIFSAFGGYKYYTLNKDSAATKADLGNKITDLESRLAQAAHDNTSLSDALYAEQAKNLEFENQIEQITGAVGKLEKLSKTDPELLKKYSKIYFLNENYQPARLVRLTSSYLFNKNDEEYISSQVLPFLKKLMDAADDEGLDLKITSGYRSFGTQATLKSNYTVTYGAGTANAFSADQGYSEHQLGTTVDFTTPTVGAPLTGFEKTPEYAWLVANAYKYGFELSYPEGNAFYLYEPWHWRFVGTKLTKKLRTDNVNFYDMEQRDIDKYLINLFD